MMLWMRLGMNLYDSRIFIDAPMILQGVGRFRHGIFPVRGPLGLIVRDVFPNAGRFIFVANNVFIIIALPQFPGKRGPTVLFDTPNVFVCGHRFEPLNNPP